MDRPAAVQLWRMVGQSVRLLLPQVYNKIIRSLKIPFRMNGGDRIDDTPVHQAIREVLAGCLFNAG